jgi:uncharacterized membrane protein YfhO
MEQRFLVLNEMYARGWTARTAGQDLAIYPTNVVMRGVVIPPGAGQVTFEYQSFLSFAAAYSLVLTILAAAALATFRYGDRFSRLFGGS